MPTTIVPIPLTPANNPLSAILWILLSFTIGALPFAVWLARWSSLGDVRAIGDGNPGALNAWKLGGWRLGMPVMLLDFLKGALPVGITYQMWDWQGAWLVALSLAPILGHDFSPFLRGRGGKGLATTFGVWTGLTLAEGPLILGVSATILSRLPLRHGWVVFCSHLILLGDLLLRRQPTTLLVVWVGTVSLLLWKYRQDLHWPIRMDSNHE